MIVLAMSDNVEWFFSKGHILLSHLHSHLSVQSTHALICVRAWSLLGYVINKDIKAATTLPEELGEDWDNIL